MSGWYYLKEGMLADEEVGPLDSAALGQLAFDGKLKLKTKLRHPSQTGNQWVFLEHVPTAKQKLDEGIAERKRLVEEAKAAKQRERLARVASPEVVETVTLELDEPEAYRAQVVHEVPARPTFQFRCPYCQSTLPPVQKSQVSTTGWAVFIVLFVLLCWPFFLLGMLIQDHYLVCQSCNMKLGPG